jgi:adenine-specific DNA-methyltransferase
MLAEHVGTTAAQLEPIQAGYLIGTIYAAMLPEDLRARLGAYYTPPPLVDRLLAQATETGVDWTTCRVLDPACGGGAFLAPVARRMVLALKGDPSRVLRHIAERLVGFEIDPFAGWMSQVFVEAILLETCRSSGKRLPRIVTICDSLRSHAVPPSFDLVIGNPPYGRTRLDDELRGAYKRSLYGHANLYGIFTDLALRQVRAGGVVSYVTPSSFLGGQYFKRLRRLLATEAPPACIEFVSARKGIFDDVLQETVLATYRRGGPRSRGTAAVIEVVDLRSCTVKPAGSFELPPLAEEPWIVPRQSEQAALAERLRKMPHRLRDWGYSVSTGPLVWNRHKSQLRQRFEPKCVPLIWAEAVTPDGRFSFRAEKRNHAPFFRLGPRDHWLAVREPCVLLQRTTAKEQERRLVAAELPESFVAAHGAVTVENHLNMLRPQGFLTRVRPEVVAAFLNSSAADRAFRCVNGSVAVSAFELESLPLPAPDALDELARLVASRAARLELDQPCARLYGLEL